MKLLVVIPNYPYPPRIGSAIVAYHIIREIVKKHSVDLICYGEPQDKGEFVRFLNRAEFVPRRKIPRPIMVLRYIFYLILGIPPTVTAHMSHDMNMRVSSLIELGEYDAILAYELAAIQYCPKSSFRKVVANIEDPESIKLDRMRRLSVWSLWHTMKLKMFSVTADRYERKIFPRLGKVVLLSESDLLDMKSKHGDENLGYVPYGVESKSDREVPGFDQRSEGMIVFSGSMYHRPNVDGALYFLDYMFPSILLEHPSTVLWIVGSRPDRRIYRASQRFKEHVVITGTVKDVSEYLLRARVSICPVRLQIGVQTKILEAMSCGTPVVTLSAGNSGIGGISGKELWVEDESDQFAKRVVALLRNEDWLPLSKGGVSLVKERFSWKHSAEILEKHLAEIHSTPS